MRTALASDENRILASCIPGQVFSNTTASSTQSRISGAFMLTNYPPSVKEEMTADVGIALAF